MDNNRDSKRRHFSPQEKVAAERRPHGAPGFSLGCRPWMQRPPATGTDSRGQGPLTLGVCGALF